MSCYLLKKLNKLEVEVEFELCTIISVPDEFHFRGGGGGWSLLPEYFSQCLHENQVHGFARILQDFFFAFFFFVPENGYLKNSRGAASPLAPWRIRLYLQCIYARSTFLVHFKVHPHSRGNSTVNHLLETLMINIPSQWWALMRKHTTRGIYFRFLTDISLLNNFSQSKSGISTCPRPLPRRCT